MFLRSNLEEVTKNKVYLKLGTLNRWPTKVFKDLMNMAFTLFSGTSPTVTEVPAPNSDPVVSKEHRQVQGLDLECSDSKPLGRAALCLSCLQGPTQTVDPVGSSLRGQPQVSPRRLGPGSQRPVLYDNRRPTTIVPKEATETTGTSATISGLGRLTY